LAKIDRISTLDRKALGLYTKLTDAEREELHDLVHWRANEDRVRRVLRFAPVVEVDDEESDHTSGMTPATRAKVRKQRNVIQLENFGMSSAWRPCRQMLAVAHHSASHESGSRSVRSRFTAMILVERKPEHYIMNVELPMAVLTSLNYLAFTLHGERSDQISISLTLVLTAVAYKLTVASTLPVVSYTTMLDNFISTCFLFMVVATVEPVLVSALVPDDSISQDQLNSFSASVWLLAWLAYLAWHLWDIKRLHTERARLRDRFDGGVGNSPSVLPVLGAGDGHYRQLDA